MPSDLIQTSSNLFQNMLLQHVWFYLLKLAKHSSLSQKKVVNKTQPYSSQPCQDFTVKYPKETEGKGRKARTWTNGLAVFQLGMKKSISTSPYKTHPFAVYSYEILCSHPHTEQIYFFIFYTNM